MKKYTLILLLIISTTYAFIAFGKDLIVTLSNNDVISIPLETGSKLDVISTPGSNEGNVTVTISENPLELCERIKAVDATVTCTGGSSGTAPTITSFTVSPTSITSGGNVTLTWVLANDAVSCVRTTTSGSTGNWSGTITGSQVTNGSHSQLISNITTNSTYRLQCTNSNGSSLLKAASVSIATSASCVSQPPPPSPIIGEDLTIVANAPSPPLSYNGMFSNLYSGGSSSFPWPGIAGGSLRLSLEKNKYIAAQFTTGPANTTGQINNIPVTNFEGPAATGLTWAISECPGDFVQHLGQAKCTTFGTLRWSLEGTGGAARCQLQPNTTYYLNMIHVKPAKIDAGDWTSDCSTSYCGQLSTNTF